MIPTAGLDPAYAKAAMALNPGQTSDLVRSQFGYHIIQTEQKDAAHVQALAEVKSAIVPIAGAAEGGRGGAELRGTAGDARRRRRVWTRRRRRMG